MTLVPFRLVFARPLSAPQRHWLCFGGILLLGLGLRLLGLAAKPLWVDEIITSVFALGRSFDDIPVEQVIPLAQVPDIFTWQPGVSCGAIATHLAEQSTHPPLFFCLLYSWLGIVLPKVGNLAWALRSFSVFWGVGAIAALYWLNRVAFSPRAGLWGAAVMALSPFAVYLAQEARHYTLPILLITVSLALQIHLQRDLERGKSRLWLWTVWGLCHCIALYSHYFCFLALAAQGLTLLLWLWRSKIQFPWRGAIAYTVPLWGFLPWLQILLTHTQSPKTGWLSAPSGLAPIAQTLAGWIVMVISLPVERQPLSIQIGVAILTLVGLIGLGRSVWPGLRHLYQTLPGQTLIHFSLIAIALFFVIIYGLQKDISIAPRYHFVYFPALVALIGGAIGQQPQLPTPLANQSESECKSRFPAPHSRLLILLLLSISSLCVVTNLAFTKPYAPDRVAAQFNTEAAPVTVMMAYHNTLEMAVGLSYGLELAHLRRDRGNLVLVEYTDTLDGIWQKLAEFPIQPIDLWAIAPGYYDDTYPDIVRLSQGQHCRRDRQGLYREGFPYQRYRCGATAASNSFNY